MDTHLGYTPPPGGRTRLGVKVLSLLTLFLMLAALVPSGIALANVTVNLDQWANGSPPPTGAGWQNGDLNRNNSTYAEGKVVPFRLAIEGLTAGSSHTITIEYDFTAGGHEAYDFLASYNASYSPDLCGSGGGAVSSLCPSSLGTAALAGFPADPNPGTSGLLVSGAQAYANVPRQMTLYGGTFVGANPITVPSHTGSVNSNSSAEVTVSFQATGTAVLFAWGGHLAQSAYWDESNGGSANGAGQISGAPWHMANLALDSSNGKKAQDRSIQPSALGNLSSPAITTQASNDTSGAVNSSLTVGDTATITGGDTLDGQTVTFTLYGSDCSTSTGISGPGTMGTSGGVTSASFQTNWTPTATGTYYWVASYAGDANNTPATSACPDANEAVVVGAVAPTMSITKSNDTTGPVTRGTAVDYTLTLHVSNGPVPSATVVDQLPPDMGAPTNIVPSSGTYDSTANTITWDLSNVTDGQTLTYTAAVASSATDQESLTNTATITSGPCTSTGCSDTSTVTVTVPVPGLPDVSITKSVNGSSSVTITGGQTSTLTYVITVRNTGDAATATDYSVSDNDFPAFFTPTSVTCSSSVSSCTYAALTSSNGIDLGILDAGGTWTITVVGSASPNTTTDVSTSPQTNTAYVCPVLDQSTILGSIRLAQLSEGCLPASASVGVTYTPLPPPNNPLTPKIAITKVANPTHLGVGGGSVTYTYTVTNPGSAPLSNITVTDNKCSPVTYVSGDMNADKVLETNETWTYTCTTNITQTTTNTATATGSYNGVTVTATAQATVTVAPPTPKPTGAVAGATGTPSLPPTTSLPGQGGGPNGTILLLLGALGAASLALISLTLLRERLLDSVDR